MFNIKETLIIPDAPTDIRTLLESCNLYMINRKYQKALDSLKKGRTAWRDHENVDLLGPELEMYFDISIGQIYEETSHLKTAVRYYMKARKNELYYNHPDNAIPFSWLGWVLMMLDEFDSALRWFLKAREIREERLGGDTVDTASVYNNLGCWMMLLKRNEEANAYFELSYVILDSLLGSAHERCLLAKENFQRSRHKFLEVRPTYPRMWYAAVVDPTGGQKKKKKKGKKGKKKK
jgi:tetratricopeptide (TPR) repeat protein